MFCHYLVEKLHCTKNLKKTSFQVARLDGIPAAIAFKFMVLSSLTKRIRTKHRLRHRVNGHIKCGDLICFSLVRNFTDSRILFNVTVTLVGWRTRIDCQECNTKYTIINFVTSWPARYCLQSTPIRPKCLITWKV